MPDSTLIKVADGFWNVRGSFKVGGVIDVGTHCSLVRLGNGNYVFLDAYTFDQATRAKLDAIIGSSGVVEAIINLHPFHTVHVAAMHRRYPRARLYGTARHRRLFPGLPWEAEHSEDTALHERYADDFAFSVPDGVTLVPANENIHFSSVLALHRDSKAIHVDDTFMYRRLPSPLAMIGVEDFVGLHPTLPVALEKRAGAVREFRQWLDDLAAEWGDACHLCAAHSDTLLAQDNRGKPIAERLVASARPWNWLLDRLEQKYG